jgi:osmoprotectant transport system ATP-binding protein
VGTLGTITTRVITLRDVTKRIGSALALDRVSIEVAAGATHVLLGSSGAGKSTVLRLILGLTSADEGAVVVDGTTVDGSTRATLVRRMGYVVQDGGLYPHMTAGQNVSLAAEARGWPRSRIEARLHALAEMTGIGGDMLRRLPRELSGGQRQRVGLMRALMLDPPVLLLDEPLGELDPIVRAELQAQLVPLFASLGKTVVLVTHDLREAALFGSAITLMHDGRIVQQGTFADLTERPAVPFVAEFLNAQSLAGAPRGARPR